MNVERATLWICRVLLRAFPDEFKQAYGVDLADMTEDVIRDIARRQGRRQLVLMAPRLFVDLILRIAAEHWRDAQRDARHAVRLLGRAPGFTAASVLCLAIGSGLTAAMYAQVQSTILADLPGGVRDTDALIRADRAVSGPDFDDLREGVDAQAELAGYIAPVPATVDLEHGERRRRVWGHLATPNYFEVLGIHPVVGRLFAREERIEGTASVVLGERLWRTHFEARPSIVGDSIRINGQLVTVIGIASAGFAGPSPMTAAADLWIPTTASPLIAPELNALGDRRVANVQVLGRLRSGVSMDRAEVALQTVAHGIQEVHGAGDLATSQTPMRLLPGGRLFAIRDEELPRAIGFPLVLASLVLLMACGNVANMMLARGANRYREFAIRLALGAGRGRVVRQLVTESVILSVLGSLAGLLFAFGLLSLFDGVREAIPEYVQFDVRFQWRAYFAAAAIAAASTIVFSMAPSLRTSRLDIQASLKTDGVAGLHRRRLFGLRNLVIYQQVAASVVLILLTGFVVIGWQRAAVVDLGFNPAQLYLLRVDPIRDGLSLEQTVREMDRIEDGLRMLPGVTHVAVAQTVPLAMSTGDLFITMRTSVSADTRSLGTTRIDRVGDGFFETVGTRVVRGRAFAETDRSNAARVVVVNETMAARAWPGSDAMGQRLTLGEDQWEVVGIVEDMRSAFPLAPPLPAVYQPITPEGFANPTKNGVAVVARTGGGADGAALLSNAVRSIAPNLTIVEVRPLTREVDQSLFLARLATATYGGMGVFGLILAAVGLAGVTAYTVARRTREIGLRMALGASRAHVLWLVLREGTGIILAGTATGLVLALAVTRALSSVLETLAEATRTSVSDPIVLLGGPGLLVALALIACYVPARRSIRIDPMIALRSE